MLIILRTVLQLTEHTFENRLPIAGGGMHNLFVFFPFFANISQGYGTVNRC